MDEVFEEVVRVRRDGLLAALATIVDRKGSTPGRLAQKMLVHRDGSIVGTVGGGCVEADVIREALSVMETGRPRKFSFRLVGEEAERTGLACGGTLEIMIEPLNDPRVHVVGCGHVGRRIAHLAHRVGFKVTALDDRPDFANPDEFPGITVVCRPLDELAEGLDVRHGDFVISVTRGHDHDYEVLQWALTTEARGIGVIGSRSKGLRFRKALVEEGVAEDALEGRVHCPVGLDIGADTPDEIAVSVVAWLIAERRGLADC